MLAGCSDLDGMGELAGDRLGHDSNGADHVRTPDPGTDGQFRLTTRAYPDRMHFLWDVGIAADVPYRPAEDVYVATHEPPLWGRWYHHTHWLDPGETTFGLYEACEITTDRIAVTIRDDAYWSDGEPVRAYDAYGQFAFHRMPPRESVVKEDDWHPAPDVADRIGIHAATREVRMPDGPDGRRIEFHAQDGEAWDAVDGYALFLDGELLYELGGPAPTHGVRYPSHVEPYASVAAEAIEQWEATSPDPRSRSELAAEHVSRDDFERSRTGGHYVSNGPWTLAEVVGTEEVVLTKNEYHRDADDLPFDEVVLETGEEQRIWSGLRGGRYDYAQVDVPEHLLDTFADQYEEVTAPSPAGFSIAVDHASVLGDVELRQAMLYALDTEMIAQNIHPTVTQPVTTPGWDTWAADSVIDQAWAAENLIEYPYDPATAAEKMREAGYEMDGDRWHRDGEMLKVGFGSDIEYPPVRIQVFDGGEFEQSVHDQFTEFGFEVTYTSIQRVMFAERWQGSDRAEPFEAEFAGNGEYDLWTGRGYDNQVAGYYHGIAEHFSAGLSRRERVRARNYFEHDVQEAALQEYADDGTIDGRYELWKEWTIALPPTGEPNGPREPFNPAYTWEVAKRRPAGVTDPQLDNPYYDPPRTEPHEDNASYFWQQFAWTCNWFLPVLPVTKTMTQHYPNEVDWRWPTDHELWRYLGMGWDGANLIGMNRIEKV